MYGEAVGAKTNGGFKAGAGFQAHTIKANTRVVHTISFWIDGHIG